MIGLRLLTFGMLLLVVTSCSVAAVETTTTTIPSTTTTTTTLPTTTTTTPPISIDEAPPELVALVGNFCAYATGETSEIPPIPESVATSITPAATETPRSGVASQGTFMGTSLVTIEMDGDLFLAADDGAGWRIVGGYWPSLGLPSYYGSMPRIVAVLGSDARPGEDVASKLADSIHLVGLDGAGGGGVVGIPRDSWVAVPNNGQKKITGVLPDHGPDLLTQTLREMTGLPIEGYVLTGFVGFQEMLGNILGGIRLTIPFPIYDSASGASFEAGEQYLNGPDALALARARKTLPRGDFDRSEHQGLIMIEAVKTVQGRGYGSIPPLMELSEPWLLTNLTPEQLLTFSALAIGSDLDAMPNLVAPGRPGRVGSASVVFLSDSVSELWSDLSDGDLEG